MAALKKKRQRGLETGRAGAVVLSVFGRGTPVFVMEYAVEKAAVMISYRIHNGFNGQICLRQQIYGLL